MLPFNQEHFINLAKYQIYQKLLINGLAGYAFSDNNLMPSEHFQENEEKIIRVSRERYVKTRTLVEEKIAKWSF